MIYDFGHHFGDDAQVTLGVVDDFGGRLPFLVEVGGLRHYGELSPLAIQAATHSIFSSMAGPIYDAVERLRRLAALRAAHSRYSRRRNPRVPRGKPLPRPGAGSSRG